MKKINNSNYDTNHLSIAGQSYVKVCFLILDAIDAGKLKDFEQKQILIPLIYNFRHAAELFLKSVLLKANIEFKATHDLTTILTNTMSQLTTHFSDSFVPQACTRSFLEFKREIELIKNNEFAGIRILDKEDKQNESFRFPEKGLSNQYANLNLINFSLLRDQIKAMYTSYLLLQSAMSVQVSYK